METINEIGQMKLRSYAGFPFILFLLDLNCIGICNSTKTKEISVWYRRKSWK